MSLLSVCFAAVGCGDPGKPVRQYTLKDAPSPLDEVRTLLERYAEGQPVGSEVINFEALVGRVREADPERAMVLEQGLAAIAQSPATAAARARQLLKQLGPA
ncbi:MAG: hypothetical protein K8S94_15725 [Planctomycetia bacterium]|nr:hypothetical protein [Planctomycetia bacterium]